MMLLIYSDMPIFAVGLILKHLSWHVAVKPVWVFSDSWHVAVNSDIKQTMHGMGVHDIVVHDVAVPGMAMPSMDVSKMLTFTSGKKLIFDAHLGEKRHFFPIICR
jgi:hypothetical protein